MGSPMLKIRQSWDRLIFNMGIPILVRRHFYIDETPPEYHVLYCVTAGPPTHWGVNKMAKVLETTFSYPFPWGFFYFHQIMACCQMAPNHYLNQSWPTCMMEYGSTRTQWGKYYWKAYIYFLGLFGTEPLPEPLSVLTYKWDPHL